MRCNWFSTTPMFKYASNNVASSSVARWKHASASCGRSSWNNALPLWRNTRASYFAVETLDDDDDNAWFSLTFLVVVVYSDTFLKQSTAALNSPTSRNAKP